MELRNKIIHALNEIRPFLAADGGDISLVDILDEKIVKVKPLEQKDLVALRETMTKYVGVERDQVGLEKAFDTVRDIYLKYQEQGYDNNSLITSLLIIKSAMNRTEQRGSHYRTDHPYQDNKLNSRSSITKEDLNL